MDGSDLKVGVYQVTYKMYFERYPSNSVEPDMPFSITVEDACGMETHNSLTASDIVD